MRGVELTPEVPVAEVAALGERAEAAGFDTAFASCHYYNRDPYVALSRVAAATDDVRLGPAAANPYQTHPVALASRVATIAEVSEGRAVCGLAPGDRSTLAALDVERERPLRRTLETMRVARRLWAGETVNHGGTFGARDAALKYDPPGEIPVYVGAQGPHMIRMAAKHADGVLLNASHPRDLDWARQHVEAGTDARDPDREAVDVAAYVCVSVADDAEAAREAARPPVAFVVGGADRRVLDRHDVSSAAADAVGECLERGDFSGAFERVTERMLDAFCVAGAPETVTERLAAVGEFVDSVVVGAPLGPDRAAAVELAGEALDRVSEA